MSLEQTIKDTIVSESYDLDGRLQQLVRAGLMPANTIPVLRKAISKVQGGMTLQGAERDVMANFINSMMFIVLGDDAIFNRARAGAKTYATEAKEKQEYDYEGDMAMSQLKSIIANSQQMHDMLSEDTNLPEWVQSKITLAEDYLSTASNYMQGEMNEERIDELSKKTMGSYVKKASGAEQPKNVMSPKNVPLTKIAAYQGDSETGHFGKRFNQATYDKAERLRKNRETGIKRAVDKITKEDVELDEGNTNPEIKKAYADLIKTPSGSSERKTAIRHYKSLRQNLAKEEVEITEASVADVAKTAHLHVRAGKHDSIHTAIQSAVNTHFPSSVHSSVTRKKVAAQALSRIQSMNKSKMTKEEVEQVDEISKAMAGRYVKKAAASVDLTAWRQGYKEAGAGNPSKHLEKKLSKRHKGIETAVKKLTKEESEQIDELSKKTLGSYVKKASHDVATRAAATSRYGEREEVARKAGDYNSARTNSKIADKAFNKGWKRRANMAKAVDKLTKEDIDAAKSMNESYKTKFDAALEHYNIKSPSELGEEQRKEFFNHVDLEFKKGDK